MRVAGTAPVQAEPSFRLNPFTLPARYEAFPAGTATGTSVYLDRKVAILRRRVAGLPLNIRIPIKMYRGVAIRFTEAHDTPVRTEILLAHRDPALHLVLSCGEDAGELAADWLAWANLFGLPLLVAEDDGSFRSARTYLGRLKVSTPRERRYHAQFAERRPRFLSRRKPGRKGPYEMLEGREIIARS
jgi:Family of unknown function (DUF6101)